MAITTRDQLIDALANNSSRILFDKASLSNSAAGLFFSLFKSGGFPSAGTNPTTAAICNQSTVGAMTFANQTAPAKSYLSYLFAAGGNALTNVDIVDRLCHMGGLNGTLNTQQTVDLDPVALTVSADRYGAADLSDIQWWLEIYTALGATGVNATVNVTYTDTTSGNLTVIALGTNPRLGRLYPLNGLVDAGKIIEKINHVTLSATTGAAGDFGFSCTRTRTVVSSPVANLQSTFDWAQLGLPTIANDSCLMFVQLCTTTTTGTLRGGGKIAHG
jgi:hypothetical protein